MKFNFIKMFLIENTEKENKSIRYHHLWTCSHLFNLHFHFSIVPVNISFFRFTMEYIFQTFRKFISCPQNFFLIKIYKNHLLGRKCPLISDRFFHVCFVSMSIDVYVLDAQLHILLPLNLVFLLFIRQTEETYPQFLSVERRYLLCNPLCHVLLMEQYILKKSHSPDLRSD